MRITRQDLKIYVYPDRDWYIIWSKNIARHREDGPAIIWSDGQEYFRIKNRDYDEDEYWKEIHENY